MNDAHYATTSNGSGSGGGRHAQIDGCSVRSQRRRWPPCMHASTRVHTITQTHTHCMHMLLLALLASKRKLEAFRARTHTHKHERTNIHARVIICELVLMAWCARSLILRLVRSELANARAHTNRWSRWSAGLSPTMGGANTTDNDLKVMVQ